MILRSINYYSECTHVHRIVAYPDFVQYERLVGVNVPQADVDQLILGQTEMTSRTRRARSIGWNAEQYVAWEWEWEMGLCPTMQTADV